MPMIDIDPHGAYHFGYPLFETLPDLMTRVNSFNDLKKNIAQILLKLFTHYIFEHWICNRLNQLRMEF